MANIPAALLLPVAEGLIHSPVHYRRLERRCRKTEQDTIAYAERASAVWGLRIRASASPVDGFGE